MFRKLILALAATAAIGATTLAPTAASAKVWGWHHHHRHWIAGFGFYGPGFYGPGFVFGGNCYFVDRVVHTPYGKRIRTVEVCT
jgi:hypothetical protein